MEINHFTTKKSYLAQHIHTNSRLQFQINLPNSLKHTNYLIRKQRRQNKGVSTATFLKPTYLAFKQRLWLWVVLAPVPPLNNASPWSLRAGQSPCPSVFQPAPASLSHKTFLTDNWWDNIVRGGVIGGGVIKRIKNKEIGEMKLSHFHDGH